MKKYILITVAFLFLVPFILKAQVQTVAKPGDTINKTDVSGLRTGYWEEKSGEVMNKGTYNQSKKEGCWIGFYPNNVIAKLEYFKNGLREGPSVQLDRRGKVSMFETYHQGTLSGQQIVYSQVADFPVSETNYFMGVKNGLYRLYYDNGKIQEESNYLQNMKDGPSRWFNKNGRMMAEYNYKSGSFEGVQKTFYDNDTVQVRSNYVKNELSGEYKEFYRNGKPKITGKYLNGLKEGPWIEYDETGKAVKTTKYKAGNGPK
ncbi:MAG: hypothetical protein NTU51_11370 [Bacteroidetes bacterium]|nr:hypothetical protein [Bacteroidota bacterium]